MDDTFASEGEYAPKVLHIVVHPNEVRESLATERVPDWLVIVKDQHARIRELWPGQDHFLHQFCLIFQFERWVEQEFQVMLKKKDDWLKPITHNIRNFEGKN